MQQRALRHFPRVGVVRSRQAHSIVEVSESLQMAESSKLPVAAARQKLVIPCHTRGFVRSQTRMVEAAWTTTIHNNETRHKVHKV